MDRRAFLRRATAVAGVAAIAPVAAFLPAPATYKVLVIGKERLEQIDVPYPDCYMPIRWHALDEIAEMYP